MSRCLLVFESVVIEERDLTVCLESVRFGARWILYFGAVDQLADVEGKKQLLGSEQVENRIQLLPLRIVRIVSLKCHQRTY